MKKLQTSTIYLILFSFLFLSSSCSTEEDLDFIIKQAEEEMADDPTDGEESPEDEPVDEPTDPTEPDDPPNTDEVGTLPINETPCDYGADTFASGQTYQISCTLDLGGQTVTLPSNVILEYDGGQIINGTLNFDNGQIDGRLLNKDLQISGSATLISEIFDFYPERWDFVQGETTSDIAQKNNDNLEGLMFFVKDLSATTFNMGKFDAYFEINKVTSTTSDQNFYPFVEAVNIPGDFNLIMSDETVLRVFPTDSNNAASLLAIHEVSNVNVQGGVLYGARDLYNYTRPNAEEGSHLFTIRSGNNVVLDGIKFVKGALSGVNINSTGFTFTDNYNPTRNVTVRNCVFEKVRTIALALTDGRDILIENNTFIDTAQPTPDSDGGVVGHAIDIEPVRQRDAATNEIIDYQRVQDVIIRGNTERNSRVGSFTIFVGDNIIIENNNLDTSAGWSFASNSKIRNNTFTAESILNKPAIIAGGSGDTVFNNEIYGNTITGYSTGITGYLGKMKIYDNTINNTINAIQLFEFYDAEITGNTILSSRGNSRGITFQITHASNVLIANNSIDVQTAHLNFIDLNQGAEYANNTITVERNNFDTSDAVVQFSKTSGVIFQNNESLARIQMSASSGVEILTNTINTDNGHGIALSNVNTNITINNNTITKPSNFECILINSTTSESEVSRTGNSCN
ncbi:right-handed parallel beta-helix repeat-containing protein [Spongiivirga citrea]|uniref:Uncharacterized protein n=1 Tax=Spongiivirga citrea TaxID=1481457 RepID=A0A6M0CFB8_9FLAO|nr:right-handed parallel beta-helix repeat-containing protein [Spongiivirga citrea]NER15573.1 hypothetical protein [Spongiivirga citrea]